MHFYIFETQKSNVYVFGMSNQTNIFDRLKKYNGCNKPKRYILIKYTKKNLECDFKHFLAKKKIPIIYDQEFFEYTDDIEELINNFLTMKIEYVDYTKVEVNKKYFCKICNRYLTNSSHYIAHLKSKEHRNNNIK